MLISSPMSSKKTSLPPVNVAAWTIRLAASEMLMK